MKISQCMKPNVISIPDTSTIREAAAVFVQNHVGLLPVVDKDDKPIGVVGLRDLISLQLPDFVNFVADVDFVHDFGAVEETRPSASVLNKTVKSLMRPMLAVQENCGLLRAYALLLQQNLHDMPVVSKEGKLIGIASRVDIGAAILKSWSGMDK